MSQFKVGDVCVGQHFINWPELNGMECVVESALHMSTGFDPRTCQLFTGMTHVVVWEDGARTFAEPKHLRLKRPPTTYDGDTAGDWGLCPWKPAQVRA
jgi:hypothetical protein